MNSQKWPEALPHGPLEEVLSGIFQVTGAMETVLLGADWTFSRTMTVLRDGDNLTVVNSIRLDEAGLEALAALGAVRNVVRLGSLHGRDDGFYVERFGARLFAPPGVGDEPPPDVVLESGGEMPVACCTVFQFETSAIPEAILHLDRHGGVLIACDALQNWERDDEWFSPDSVERMQEMGFFQRANFGPVWMMQAAPGRADFDRLLALPFRHALCGHGRPLLDEARAFYLLTAERVFAA